MHAILQIITDHFPTPELIDEIMKPYNEDVLFDRYEEDETIPKEDWPEFTWDYYLLKDLFVIEHGDPEEVGKCMTIINKQRKAVSKYKWNGEATIDQMEKFKAAVLDARSSLTETDWVSIVDYHW